MRPRRLFFVLILRASRSVEAAVYSGGAGHAIYTQWTKSQVLSTQWLNPPKGDLTVEHWIMICDPMLAEQGFLSYSAYDINGHYGEGGLPYEQSNELLLYMSPGDIRWRHETTIFCEAKECLSFYAEPYVWHHLAVSWNTSSGLSRVYVNGSFVTELEANAEAWRQRLQPNGVLHFGQEADSPWSSFDELQSFEGFVDELRIWSRVRTEDEIKADYWRSPIVTDDSLHLHYDFDELYHDERGRLIIRDKGSGGHDALWGRLPTIENTMQYQTNRGIVPPENPSLYPSTAPILGQGTAYYFLKDFDDLLRIELRVFDEDNTILELSLHTAPQLGSLFRTPGDEEALEVGDSIQKTVWYRPHNAQSSQGNDTFRYFVPSHPEDQFTVHILVSVVPDPPAMTTVNIFEDEPKFISLGAALLDGSPAQVVIEQVPSTGSIAQIAFEDGSDESYAALVYDRDTAKVIEAEGTVNNSRGVIVYYPKENDDQDVFFFYSYKDPTTGEKSSIQGRVNINIVSSNDPPVPVPDMVRVDSGKIIGIKLNASDVDGSFAPYPNATIVTLPQIGKLFQFNSSNEISVDRQPLISSYASEVVRFSSQFSLCGPACYEWRNPQCTSNDNGNAKSSESGFTADLPMPGDQTCREISWHSSRILGVPDLYPSYTDDKNGYDFASEKYGREWIELRVGEPFYIEAVNLYETFKPSSLTEIAVTDNYADDNSEACFRDTCSERTSWHVLWRGEASPAAEEARIYAPPTCSVALKSQVIRLVFDTLAVPGWQNHDAVQFQGYADLPPGTVVQTATGDNIVVYKPLDGVHGIDSFNFQASDCVVSSESAQIVVLVDAPATESGEFSFRSPFNLSPFSSTLHFGSQFVTPYDAAEETMHIRGWPEGLSSDATIELRAVSDGVELAILSGSSEEEMPFLIGQSYSLGQKSELALRLRVSAASPDNFSSQDVIDAYSAELDNLDVIFHERLTRLVEVWIRDDATTYRVGAVSCWAGLVAFLTSDNIPQQFLRTCLVCRSLEATNWFDASKLSNQDLSFYLSVCGSDTETNEESSPFECNAGQFFDASTFKCMPCASGSFTDRGGETSCKPCGLGTFQPVEGSTKCTECDARSYSGVEGARSCSPCPPNTAIRGALTGAESSNDCLPLFGFYSRKWPVPSSGAIECPSGAVCDGGLIQPYPKSGYWLALEYWKGNPSQRAKVYQCRYPQLCRNNRMRAVSCSFDFVSSVFSTYNSTSGNGTGIEEYFSSRTPCLDVDGAFVELAEPSDQEWCDTGGSIDAPMCEDPIISKKSRAYFALTSKYLRCPSKSKTKRLAFSVGTLIFVFCLFIAINDYIRPKYRVLDIVLDSYQNLGLISAMWLRWPNRLSFLFTIYGIALFDIDVVTPHCAFSDWDYPHAFALMNLLPFAYCLCRYLKFRIRYDRNDVLEWNRCIGSCQSFVLGSLPSLMTYSFGMLTQRRIEGYGIVLAQSPGTEAGQLSIRICQGAAILILFSLGTITVVIACHLLMLYKRDELMTDWCLARYGFAYRDYNSNALYWGISRVGRSAFLATNATILWKHPFSQAIAAISCLLLSLQAQCRVGPYINPIQNLFERLSLMLSIFTAALGMLFSSRSVDERGSYIVLYYLIQAMYLGLGLCETVKDVRIIDGRAFAKRRVNKVLLNNDFTVSSHGVMQTLKRAMSRQDAEGSTIDGMEVFDTFRGNYLERWGKNPKFSQEMASKLTDLDRRLAPFVSDESHTNNFSRRPTAKFYRRLIDAFPYFIDMLVDLHEDKWETVRTWLDALAHEFADRREHSGGSAIATTIENIDKGSVTYFLVNCQSNKDRVLFKEFIVDLIKSSPRLSAKRNKYLRLRSIKKIQRAWVSRKLRHQVRHQSFRKLLSRASSTCLVKEESVRLKYSLEKSTADHNKREIFPVQDEEQPLAAT